MLKPLADRVLIRLEAKEEKTKSGIFLPDTAKEKPHTVQPAELLRAACLHRKNIGYSCGTKLPFLCKETDLFA